jgi:lysophospholipase L1-like esterase
MVWGGILSLALQTGATAEGISRGSTEDGVTQQSQTIVVIGASYARGWRPEGPVAGYRIVNKGVDGQQSFEMLARFNSDVVGLKPDAVIIWGFINDIFRNDRDRIGATLARTKESVLAMVDASRKAHIVPILATEVTIRPKRSWLEPFQTMIGSMLGKTSYQDYINQHVLETNRWIRELAAQEKLPLLDLEMLLSDQSHMRRKEFASDDGSHISPAGYNALHAYVEESLKRLGVVIR